MTKVEEYDLNKKMINEADEFSVICEHIEDEPSIHVRTLDKFQNILSKNL